MNVLLDAIRAGSNWVVADELEKLLEALKSDETAAKQSITVVEDEI